MRQFILYNAKGLSYDLNRSESFLFDPEGLGFKYKSDFINLQNNFKKYKSELEQPKPKGTIKFNTYEEYFNFARFISYTPLKLEYTAYKKFYVDCEFEELKKSEIEEGGLKCDFTIVAFSPFYELVTKQNDSKAAGKVYSYTYPYTYTDSATGTVQFDIDSNLTSGVIMYMMGPCINPSWSHFVNGVKRISGKINATIVAGNKLVVDTTKIPYSIKELDSFGNVVTDRYKDSDYSTERFIVLENGENIISCSHEGTETTKVILEGHIYYDTV